MDVFAYLRTEKLTVATAGAANSLITNDLRPILLAVVATVPVHVVTGLSADSPTATTDDAYLPAGDIHYIPLPAGSEVSLLGAGSGSAWVSEIAPVR